VLLAAAAALDLLLYHRSPPPPAATPTATAITTSPVPPPFGIDTIDAAQTPYSSRVVWTTTADSTGTLRWAPEGMRPLLGAASDEWSTQHALTLDALAPNTTYVAELSVRSRDGDRAQTTLRFTTAAAPATFTASARDGAIRVDGAAFFPLLAWEQCADRWPASVTDGIDLFAGNQCTDLSSLASGVAGKALVAGTSDDPSVALPGLLGWFYPDEADARGLTGASLVPTAPGLHFLTLTQHFFAGAAPLPAGRGMYPGLIARADVVGFDLYPLQEICRRDFLPAVFDAQRALVALAPGKPTFQWIETRAFKCANVPVTPATVRAESWLAIAGGAHGLGFFPNDWDPRTGAAIGRIAARIRQLGPVLFRPARALPAPGGVRASERRFHGVRYVIAVNGGTTRASLQVPGGPRLALGPLAVRVVTIRT
jgi:hypothetical protein